MASLEERILSKVLMAFENADRPNNYIMNNGLEGFDDATKTSKMIRHIDDLEKTRERSAFPLVLIDEDGMNVSRANSVLPPDVPE